MITPIVLITLLRTLLSLYFLFLIKLLLGFAPRSRVKGKGGKQGARLGLRGRTLKAKFILVNLRIQNLCYLPEGKENKAKPSSKNYIPYLYYF